MEMKPDYGIDAPGVIRNLALVGVSALAAGPLLVMAKIGPGAFAGMLLITGCICLAEAVLMLAYSKFGKFAHRDRILAMVPWNGNEHVLDVGTGRGLLLIGAAKKLSSGKAVGIDIWSTEDLSGNNLENTMRNVDLEGVREKVELRSEDAQEMKFNDASFDVVVSNLCLHNIPSTSGRAKACQEIARILKPGGVAVISDFKNTRKYKKVFQAAGLKTQRSAPYLLNTFPPLWIVTARK